MVKKEPFSLRIKPRILPVWAKYFLFSLLFSTLYGIMVEILIRGDVMLTSIKEWSMYDTGLRSMIRKILMSVAMLILVLLLIPVPEAYAAERTVEIGIPVEEQPELFLPGSALFSAKTNFS